jgi:hypothetical protein
VVVPQTGELAHRNLVHWGYRGFGNAILATGDLGYAEQWGAMLDLINGQARQEEGRTVYPHMYGDDGWYHFTPEPYLHGALELYLWTQGERDRARVRSDAWVRFLLGENPDYPEEMLRRDFGTIRQRVEDGIRNEMLTPDTRLSDNPNPFNPAVVRTLARLMLGGLETGNAAFPLQARVRYFDPERRRAGIPADVAALVEQMSARETVIQLVNLNQVEARSLVVQGGGYGEHRIVEARTDSGAVIPVDGAWCAVYLEPGCGGRLTLEMERYANAPTMAFPWD